MSEHNKAARAFLAAVRAQAQANMNKWGLQNLETLGLALAEETGEVAQAILAVKAQGGSDYQHVIDEARHVAALCVQIAVQVEQEQADD